MTTTGKRPQHDLAKQPYYLPLLTVPTMYALRLHVLSKAMACRKIKAFEMQRQPGGKVHVKVFGGNGQGMRGVPIMPQDLFFVTSLVVRQLQASQKGG